MATVAIGVSGEGRGHGARARALAEALRDEGHRVLIAAPGDAHAMLEPVFRGDPAISVRWIPGLRFHYRPDQRLDPIRTAAGAIPYLWRLKELTRRLAVWLEREGVDMVIADFEPALPRAARSVGIPFVSVDHQNFLTACDLSHLPRGLRAHLAYMRPVVEMFTRGQAASVVSSFFFPPLRDTHSHVHQVGVLMRRELLAADPTREGHLTGYFRRFVPPGALRALEGCGRPVRVYGVGEREACGPGGRVTFHATSQGPFLADLASCDALVCTAGNQLVGEAMFLGKPVLAVAERGNHEQRMNAWFLRAGGGGDWAEAEAFDGGTVGTFLERLDAHRAALRPDLMNGLPRTLEVLRRQLRATGAPAAAAAPATPARPAVLLIR